MLYKALIRYTYHRSKRNKQERREVLFESDQTALSEPGTMEVAADVAERLSDFGAHLINVEVLEVAPFNLPAILRNR